MHNRIPPLDGVEAFITAARLGSYSAAAEVMGLTHGSVSRRIAKLERWGGRPLFERHGRGMRLTLDGQYMAQTVGEAFSLIEASADRWVEPSGSRVVRLAATPSVAGLWLMPRLRDLEGDSPKLRILLSASHTFNDLETEGVDLAIRCGRGTMPGRISMRLFEEYCQPLAAPDLLARIAGTTPERFLQAPLIHDSDASGWRAWFGLFGLDYRPRPQDRRFDDYNLVLDAAAAGLGVALSRPPLASEMVRTGRLCVADTTSVLNPTAYWLDRRTTAPSQAVTQLIQRIGMAAGLPPSTIAAFVTGESPRP